MHLWEINYLNGGRKLHSEELSFYTHESVLLQLLNQGHSDEMDT